MLQPSFDPVSSPPTPALIALPRPARTRWQPLRVGLVELFHYDAEEFWFRDGHLLLRGNNGTGKSKVLSLTLPFLLDASLSPARVEPDGDRAKRMEWNLLMGRHERRLGYSWAEFGRLDAAGAEHYLTLGCGLQAVAGRGRVDPPWYFITDQRVGLELHLISAERTTLSRERLIAALEGRGRVFERASDYRREVDARLFRLGDRYPGLIDTLIQLRQPQLSKRPDEQSLSNALSNALPELSRPVLEDVADAMNQLDVYRDELAQIEQVRAAAADFGRRYRSYAQVQARRQARQLRQAQTDFDNQSRALHESRAQLDRANAELADQDARLQTLELELVRGRAALDELRADPAMLDARRLEDLERATERAESERDRACSRLIASEVQLARERGELARCEQDERAAEQRCDASVRELEERAQQAGVTDVHQRAMPRILADEAAGATRELHARLTDREAQIERIRELLRRCDRAERARDESEARCVDRRASVESADARAREADRALNQRAAELVVAWRDYLAGLQRMRFGEPEQALAELADWVSSLGFEDPMLAPLERASQRAHAELAARQAELAADAERVAREDGELEREQALLLAGQQLEPIPLPARALSTRSGRPGAPFWRLLEFREHVGPSERAGLEAALEAAGMLDAWVSPEAVLIDETTQDAWLTPSAARPHSLLAWCLPSESAGVEPARVQALLASIAAGDADDAQADSWISRRGQFRVGRLTGAHSKPEAEYLGHAAREAARQQRLAAIEAERTHLAEQRRALELAEGELQDDRRALADELKRAPKADALRSAHFQYAAADGVRREAQDRLVKAEVEREAAVGALLAARAHLEQDAGDMRLPTAPEALDAVERALARYRAELVDLAHLLEARARTRRGRKQQSERAAGAAEQLQQDQESAQLRDEEHEDIRARRDLLLATAGAVIAELRRRLHDATVGVERIERDLKGARQQRELTYGARVRFEADTREHERRLEESTARRQHTVERLQGFAGTGLLAVAAPELELPAREQWTVDPALQLARRLEERLVRVAAEDNDWERIQREVSVDYTSLGQALSALGQRAVMETSDYGMIVQIVYGNRAERPDLLERKLADEATARRDILSAREREILENHLQSEVAAQLQRLLQEAEQRVLRINEELKRRPTTTGVYFKLDWEPLPEADGGAPVGLAAARARLLRRVPDAWSVDDRRVLGEFLRARIDAERRLDDTSPLIEHLARALDYRAWHRFRVKRWHDGAFRPLSGPASSGERALGLTVPLFAAASSYYESADCEDAPRLVLLDEAFAGIDDEARSHCMALIREFDLDFVMTSEREWGCYATLPGVSICQIIRREGIDAVYVSRWSWDGHARLKEPDLGRPLTAARDQSAST